MKLLYIYLSILGLCSFNPGYGQKQYEIDISNQGYNLQQNFLKMGANQSVNGDVLTYNNLYLVKNGKPWYPVMGEMHFSRIAKRDWETSILKMKANGIQIISTYIFWNHHEQKEGVFNWEGSNNLNKFLALCKKHHMYVWLRPGPWVHAEARYGGFPNWLIDKKIALRSNDSKYLNYCRIFFKAIAEQTDGFYFKNGGPVIGVQVENEYAFKAPEKYAHMKTLKAMLVANGFDVPYYSAFSAGPDNQDEFLFMLGSYPDSPWAQHTNKMYKPMFFIRPLEGDSDIGSDLFGKVDTKVRNTYPKLSAEIGSGMQVTYHRRVVVSPKDVVGTAFTKVASGLNGLGYYMFHGGINPVGQTTLQESRETDYPNDVPVINYDFQSPVGAMGLLAESYREYRLLHLFLNDFGSDLATEKPFFPKQMVKSYFSYDTVQTAMRVNANKGFIFLSNYQRFVDLKPVNNVQLTITNQTLTEKIPFQPVKFAANSFSIWPYNLDIGRATLYYATAQPLCILNNEDKQTTVFFADGGAEFVFEKQNIKEIKKSGNATLTADNAYYKITTNSNDEFFDVIDNKGGTVRILLLSKARALMASKIKMLGKEALIISRANVMSSANNLIIESVSDNGHIDLEIYPAVSLKGLSKSFALTSNPDVSVMKHFTLAPTQPAKGTVEFKKDHSPYSIQQATQLQDSILKSYAKSKAFNPSQPGVWYQSHFQNLPNQNLYRLKFKASHHPNVKNWVLNMSYTADVLALYKNSKLAYDQFNYNNHCAYKLTATDFDSNQNWLLQLLPLKPDYNIYVEDNMKLSKENDWNKALLNHAGIQPIWHYEIKINN